MKLRDMGEFGFIERIKRGCLLREENVIKGIGDDCCIFRSSRDRVTLLTTDILVEKKHFLLNRMPPYKLGRKSLAVNISDIAAMGGTPKEAVISIAVPDTVDMEYLDSLYDGLKSMAGEFAVNLLGGDTAASPQHLVINVALVGEAREDEILLRSGAKAGDVIFLTGTVGSAAAGLDIMLTRRRFGGGDNLLNAHCDPCPHVRAGRIISGMKIANSLIDVSDGLAADLGHICAESELGAIIEEDKIPTTAEFRAYCEEFGQNARHLSLHVGEDYVLLGTVPEESAGRLERALKSKGCEFYAVGETVASPGLRLRGRDGSVETLGAKGWDHFAGG